MKWWLQAVPLHSHWRHRRGQLDSACLPTGECLLPRAPSLGFANSLECSLPLLDQTFSEWRELQLFSLTCFLFFKKMFKRLNKGNRFYVFQILSFKNIMFCLSFLPPFSPSLISISLLLCMCNDEERWENTVSNPVLSLPFRDREWEGQGHAAFRQNTMVQTGCLKEDTITQNFPYRKVVVYFSIEIQHEKVGNIRIIRTTSVIIKRRMIGLCNVEIKISSLTPWACWFGCPKVKKNKGELVRSIK